MRPLHGIAFMLLAAGFPGLPAAAIAMEVPGVVAPATEHPASRADTIRLAVQTHLSESFQTASAQTKDARGALVEYYSSPDRQLLWVDETGLTARGKAMIAEIKNADAYGLAASDYALPDLSGFNPSSPDAVEALAAAEIEISHAVLAYAHDARGGRITPSRISRNLDPSLVLPKPLEVIESITFRSDPAAYLRSFQPQHPQFERLHRKLIALRGGEVEDENDPGIQIPTGPLLQLGVADEQVALLRTRLDVPQGDDPELYDTALAEAVKKFQRTHNTTVDGVVGPGTRRLLNKPHLRNASSPADIEKILLNMERWRWLPQDQGKFYVTVNVPEFMLRVVNDDETIHTTRVVVGKPSTPTPVFSNNIKSVVFGPYWNVPNSIKAGEIRPYIRPYNSWYGRGWDTRVFQQQELRIKYNGQDIDPATVDWSRVDIRKLQIYQPPTPRNVLGRVKFVFPNKHDVYMHDTPQKHFFGRTVRAESHGCMRVQDPDDFAAVLLKHDRNWSKGQTQSAFDTGYDQHITLNTPVPVYITYFTLWVNEDGAVTKFRDVYGHDRRMTVALLRNRDYAANHPAALSRPANRQAGAVPPFGARWARNTY